MDKCRAALILSAYLNLTIQKELINADEPGFGTENAADFCSHPQFSDIAIAPCWIISMI